MLTYKSFIVTVVVLLLSTTVHAQNDDADDRDELRMIALEALMSAPPEFALPRVKRILEQDNSDEIKESALFILSQIELPEAQQLLADTARTTEGELQEEAIQMIGIGGDPDAIASLAPLYESGSRAVREAVLEAYLIAGDSDAVLKLAQNASGDEFESIVEILGAMGAHDELQELRESTGMSEALMEAFAISGDYRTLVSIAMDDSDPETQALAIEYLGIVGGNQVGTTLVDLYRNNEDWEIKEAALEGMLIAGHDEGVLALYREATETEEKTLSLEYLTMMQSEGLWEIIDSALDGER